MNPPLHELEAYFAGDADAEQLRTIEAWIIADSANAKAFMDQLRFRELVGDRIRERSSDTGNVLAELARMEAAAPVITRPPIDLPAHGDVQKNPNEPTAQDYINAGRYALRMALTSKPAKKFYGRVAVAAGLLLAVTLLVVFTRDAPSDLNDTVADLDFWDDTDTSTPPAVAPRITAVATLTATHNAQWDSQPAEDLRRGSELHPNQTLTLTAGFAEITTNDGAIAILEAPATVELTHNNNAIRLHTGKLLGICETDSSKGFLVRTPHMDVIDLGTRFGIDASRSGNTEVHVLEGEVQAVHTDAIAGTQATHLLAGQSAQASEEGSAIARIDHDTDRFAAFVPKTAPLAGTGQGLIDGDTDPNWHIVAINGEALDSPASMKVARGQGDSTSSQWITATQGYDQQVNTETTFTVQTHFDLPDDVDADTATLILQFDANDRVTQVRINGRAITPPANSFKDEHEGLYTMQIDGPLLQEANTVQLDVVDVRRNNSTKWGLCVQWSFESATPLRNEGES